MDLDALSRDGFGYWLAGLIDGEGSFQIVPNGPGFQMRASVALRWDDLPLIEMILERTGLGRVVKISRHQENWHPLACWHVQKTADGEALIELLDYFRLRSKKARDYEVWREAVLVRATMPPPNGRRRDWTTIERLKREITNVRRYQEPIRHSPLAESAGGSPSS